MKKYFLFALLLSFIISCNDDDGVDNALRLISLKVGPLELDMKDAEKNIDASVNYPVVAVFSAPLNTSTVTEAVALKEKNSDTIIPLTFSFLDQNKSFSASPGMPLRNGTAYTWSISSDLRSVSGQQFSAVAVDFTTAKGTVAIAELMIGEQSSLFANKVVNVPVEGTAFQITFSRPIDPSTVTSTNFQLRKAGLSIAVDVSAEGDNKVVITPVQKLNDYKKYRLAITDQVKGVNGETFPSYQKDFYTGRDASPDFPVLSDEDLLTLVQQQTFKYFYDFAEPVSGMARERNSSGNLVTSGGSGFGLMVLIVGIERNFITREQGLERVDRILDFLETADRFHGAWSHWIDGTTGKVVPFSPNDNGGDLVETALLVQGLITLRQYLDENVPAEMTLIDRINFLWKGVEWDWYTQGQNVLYWHWSPDKGWIMNHPIRGHNETLITYVLAASSPDHSITAATYENGYAINGGIVSGKNFYGIPLPLGEDYGGPLFFAHYSFLGLDPRNLTDQYAEYWTQNVNHSLINQAYAESNPKGWVGYSDENWGLTASDNHQGYSAHSPTNDLGVITPTAALSSFPYTPVESMKALKFFYYSVGDRLWGEYGFYDAFNLTEGWTANSFLAIDQGPIVVMIENHRTGLLWELFMSAPEIQAGLDKLGFEY